MAITPPDHFIEWATDGGADKAKPSVTQYNLGFQTGDRAEFNSDLNYVNNLTSRWSKFNAQVNAPEIAIRNIELFDDEDFFTDGAAFLAAIHIRYDALASRWYATSGDATSNGTIRCFSSLDGVTWADTKTVITSNCDDKNCTPIYSNGTKCAVAAQLSGSGNFYVSSDNTVANLALTGGGDNFQNIKEPTSLYWDPVSSRWFVVGRNTALTNGYIESSGDDGATWVTEASSTNNLRWLASDGAGNAVCVADDATLVIYVEGGMTGAWSNGGTAAFSATKVHYLPHLDAYVSVGTGHCMLLHANDLNAAPITTDYDFDSCLFSDDLVIFEGGVGSHSSAGEHYTLLSTTGLADSYNFELLGSLREGVSNNWDADSSFEGGAGKLIYTYSNSDKLAIMTYGPGTT